MDKTYADTVRLLLSVAPDVFTSEHFAMKGGTAINLFVRDMPRLSVDIDVVYTSWETPRDEALRAITDEIRAIDKRLVRRGLGTRVIPAGNEAESKVLINDGDIQVKVEVNHVFRGTVLPVERRSIAPQTADMFVAELDAPILAVDELYGSKLVAAFDRQHPRDIFDVWQLYESGGLTDGMVECFVTYLAGHNRPTAHVLSPRQLDISVAYDTGFVGMTRDPVALDTLLSARTRVFEELPKRMTERQKAFLIGLTRAEPDWSLLRCPHASELPALKWKLINLRAFKQNKPSVFNEQAEQLERLLSGG